MANNNKFVQVGVTALRGPTGECYTSVPLYIQVDAQHPIDKNMLHDLSRIFAECYFTNINKEIINGNSRQR